MALSRRRFFELSAAALAGAGLLGTGSALAQQIKEQRFFRIGTGGLGGVYYPIGGTIALAISNPPGSRPCDKGGSCGVPGLVAVAQSSHGSLANVQAIAAGTLESGFVQADVAYWAYTGTGIFAGKAKLDSLRAIANLYPEHVHLVVRKGANIASVRDLKGKRVSLDEQGSGTLASCRLILEAFGLKEADLKAVYIPADQAIKRMKDDALDAFFFIAGYPAPAVQELANSTAIDLVAIRGERVRWLQNKYGFFAIDVIPAFTYKGATRTETLSVGAQWLVSANVSEALVHDIAAVMWNDVTAGLLAKSHPKAKLIKLETALNGLAVPLHPGAERYYRDKGVLKKDSGN